jgi:hypothetical protein
MGPRKADAAAGRLLLSTALSHKFLQTIDVDITTAFGGTDEECILVGRHVTLCDTV